MSQEYANDGWQPLYVAEMHERCAAHKLTPLTTATLTELFPGLLPPELRQLLERLGALRFRLQLPRPLESYEFGTSYGTVRGDTEVYRRAEQALAAAEGPLELAANQRIGDLREAGAPYTWLGAPRIGNGVWNSLSEQLLGAGAVIPGKKGEPLTNPTAQLKALQQQARQLEQQGLAWLQNLGVLGG